VVGAVVLVAVLLGSAVVGLVWRSRSGRMRPVPATGRRVGAEQSAEQAVLAGLGVDPAAAPVTLVQFSSAFCQPCRATRRVLGEVVRLLPEVRHVDVDAESHLDAVRALGILRTPTVLVVDRQGRVVTRATGLPRTAEVINTLAPYLA
jgi:thiol-disulfide isomerase/thioredoxin